MHTRLSLALLALAATSACRSGSSSPLPDAGPVPPAPTRVTAVVEASAIAVDWTADSTGATEVLIARATVPTATSRPASTELLIIAGVPPSASRYLDVDVESGRIYVYAVALRSAAGRSDFTIQPDAIALSVPVSPCAGERTSTDSDGDGLPDGAEASGWSVLVDENGSGSLVTRQVKSSPFAADTDGDGLCDADESSLRLDPRQADTDGDGLPDFDEINRWGSSPTNVDSDGDARGNPAFYDGTELSTFHTSPTLADTDGDGRSDFEEINQNSTNALVAELPQPALSVLGRLRVGVDVQYQNGTTQADAVTHSFEQGTSTTLSRSMASSTQHTVEEGFTVSTEASAGYPASASVQVTATASATETYVRETSASVSRSSAVDAQSTYEAFTSAAVSNDTTITGGTLALDFEVRNEGTRTFQLSRVVVTALRRDRSNPARFTSVATLAFPTSAGDLTLAEGQSAGPIRAQASISASTALDLLSNPDTLFFKAASFELTDKTGSAFSFTIGEETNSRTALLTLDYGGLRPVERYRVATNVERTATGRPAGVRLGDVLRDVLGLEAGVGFETQARHGTGPRVLTRLRDVAARPASSGGAERFWVLFTPPNPDATIPPVSERITAPTIDFEDIVLMPRDSVTVAFVADVDRDGLYEREEALYGTSDLEPDSDGDGLTDFEEVRTGWPVSVDNALYRTQPRVYSAPTADNADGDGFSDEDERRHGTDPNRRDTDGDGLADDVDPAPVEGPKGSWVKLVGTSGDDAVLQVLAEGDTVYALGTSTGDVDGDSVAGGPFLIALDAMSGAQRWVLQFEGSTKFSRKVAWANGRLTWVADLQPGQLPGVTSAAMYSLRIDPAGAVTTNNLTNGPYANAFPPGNISSGSLLESLSNGTTKWFVAPYIQYNGQPAALEMTLSATGAYSTATISGGGGTSGSYTLRASSSNGAMAAWTYDFLNSSCTGGGSLVRIGGSGLTLCPAPAPPRQLALDRRGGIALGLQGAAQDTVELRPVVPNAPVAWSTSFPSLFPGGARVTSLEVDDVNQYYVGLRGAAPGGPATLAILGPSGNLLTDFALGTSTTRITSSRRDAVGNLFLGATSVGFPNTGANPGGEDAVIVRNPQLLFGN
ncbi:MAG: hypothetical protein AB1938_29010 [Myxococcota bacterium]